MDQKYLLFRLKLLPHNTAYNEHQAIAMKKQNGNRLKKYLENVAEVKVIPDFENLATLHVSNPQLTIDGKERWETLLLHLTDCEFIESVSVYVNDDLSEKIAVNLADKIPMPWHEGYRGQNQYTLIYHK